MELSDSSPVSGSAEVRVTVYRLWRIGRIKYKEEEVEYCYPDTLLHNKCAAVSVQTSVPAGMQPDGLCNAATTPTSTQLCRVNFPFVSSRNLFSLLENEFSQAEGPTAALCMSFALFISL